MDVIELAIQLGILFRQYLGKDSYSTNRRIEDLLSEFELAAFERGQASIQEAYNQIAAGNGCFDGLDQIIGGGK